jgi:predicted transcriptional regulator
MQEVEIRVRGQIDRGWSDWFGHLTVAHTSHGDSIFTGSVRDQAELRGILSRLSDLGLELISVNTSSRSSVLKKP